MENKINIAELLKDCPKGMELDCVLFNNPVTLDEVVDINKYPCPITVTTVDGDIETFTKYGQHLYLKDAKCVIFPKGKTTWAGFVPPCKFKVGDRVQWRDPRIDRSINVIESLESDRYRLDDGSYIKFGDERSYNLLKFDINTLKPYDKVLVRLTNNCIWMPKFFSHYDPKVKCYPFVTLDNMGYPQCIPYEGNEHLCRTTDDCDIFYKTWK